MKTDQQHPLPTLVEAERELYEASLEINLRRLQAWSRLPDERTDWALEQLLDEVRSSATALRRIRQEADMPF